MMTEATDIKAIAKDLAAKAVNQMILAVQATCPTADVVRVIWEAKLEHGLSRVVEMDNIDIWLERTFSNVMNTPFDPYDYTDQEKAEVKNLIADAMHKMINAGKN